MNLYLYLSLSYGSSRELETWLVLRIFVSSFSMGMLKVLSQKSSVASIRSISVEVIDKTFAWGFFDGFAAGEPNICGAGGMLYISDGHFFSFKASLGLGTNNYAELCALKLLLILARRNSLEKIQVFGDS